MRFILSFAIILISYSVNGQTNYWPTNLTGGEKIPMFLPIPALTPGATMPGVTLEMLKTKGYANGSKSDPGSKGARNVPQSLKNAVYKRYGLDPNPKNHQPAEVDHLISIEIGGDNTIENLWPQSYNGVWNAHLKDRLEDHLAALVKQDKMPLKEAQDRIRTNWTASFVEFKLHGAPDVEPSEEK